MILTVVCVAGQCFHIKGQRRTLGIVSGVNIHIKIVFLLSFGRLTLLLYWFEGAIVLFDDLCDVLLLMQRNTIEQTHALFLIDKGIETDIYFSEFRFSYVFDFALLA